MGREGKVKIGYNTGRGEEEREGRGLHMYIKKGCKTTHKRSKHLTSPSSCSVEEAESSDGRLFESTAETISISPTISDNATLSYYLTM